MEHQIFTTKIYKCNKYKNIKKYLINFINLYIKITIITINYISFLHLIIIKWNFKFIYHINFKVNLNF